jgi:hypothetical protein
MRNIRQMSGCTVGVATLALVLLAGKPAIAETANFYLDGAGPGSTMLASHMTAPYTAQINGGPTIPAICDDFADNVVAGEDWNAYVTNLSSLTSGPADSNLYFGDSNSVVVNDKTDCPDAGSPLVTCGTLNQTLSQMEAYEAAAILAIQIDGITGANVGDQQQQDLSYAIWALFDTSSALGNLLSSRDYTDEGNAITELQTAVSDVTAGSVGGVALGTYLSNYTVTIYSYNSLLNPSGPSCGGVAGACTTGTQPQEFITVSTTAVPEASSLAEFAVYFLLGGGSLLLFGRRRIFQRR